MARDNGAPVKDNTQFVAWRTWVWWDVAMTDDMGSGLDGTTVGSHSPSLTERSSTTNSLGELDASSQRVASRVASLQLDKTLTAAHRTPGSSIVKVVVAIAGCAAIVIVVRHFGPQQPDTLPLNPTTNRVLVQDTETVLETSGHIAVESKEQVNCRVRGVIVLLNFDEGQHVRKGDLLAELDDTSYRADVQEAKAILALKHARLSQLKNGSRPEEIRQARASLQRAEHRRLYTQKERERLVQLLSDNAASQQEYDQRHSNYLEADAHVQELGETLRIVELGARQEAIDAASAEVQQAEAILMKAQYYFDSTKIVAPVDGIVLEKIAEMGQRIGLELGPSGVCVIASRDSLQAVVDIHERDLGLVTIGQECLITSESDPQQQHRGNLRWLSPMLDRKRSIREAKIQIVEPQDWLLPGMNCHVRILKPDHDPQATGSTHRPSSPEIKNADAKVVASTNSISH